MTLGVRGVVVDGEGRVLLLRHTYTQGWHFPGGGVEKGETAQQALLRELLEEAGIETTVAEMRLVSVHANSRFFPNDHVLVYRIDQWRQVEPTQKGEIAEWGFYSSLSPPEGITAGTQRRLDELFGGQAVSPHW
jgi:8-oxo-dGTP pyrophosphatase MutT (NUDIX family)